MRTLKFISYLLAFLENLCAVLFYLTPGGAGCAAFRRKKVKMRVMHGNSYLFLVCGTRNIQGSPPAQQMLSFVWAFFYAFMTLWVERRRLRRHIPRPPSASRRRHTSYVRRAVPCGELVRPRLLLLLLLRLETRGARRCISFRCSIPFLCDRVMLS